MIWDANLYSNIRVLVYKCIIQFKILKLNIHILYFAWNSAGQKNTGVTKKYFTRNQNSH